MAYGGRAAEELVFGHDRVTTGAASDIQQATAIARRYVTQWGLSDAIGPILVGDNEQELFLGREIQHRREVSEQTAQLVDAEVKRVIDRRVRRARRQTLTENIDLLHTVAAALLERETLTREDIESPVARRHSCRRARRRCTADRAGAGTQPVLEPKRHPPLLGRTGAVARLSGRGGPVARCSGPLASLAERDKYEAAHRIFDAPFRFCRTTGPPDHRTTALVSRHGLGARHGNVPLDRPRILGIVNVTPDSFSDGGRLKTVDDARRRDRSTRRRGCGRHRHRRRIDTAAGATPVAAGRRAASRDSGHRGGVEAIIRECRSRWTR